jgi:hypothetical protein
MNEEQAITAMRKALEMWTLQNLCDAGILLGFLIVGLVAARGYLEIFKARLSLRVAIEAWETLIDLGTDFLLLFVALIGLFITNTDIMADIKVAIPWVPLAFLLMGAALIVRAFYGGHKPGSRTWWTALGLIVAGCVLNWFGFTFVMEAPGDEYLNLPLADTLIALAHMRSNENPSLTMITFFVMAPLFALEFIWATVAAVLHTCKWLKRHESIVETAKNSAATS